MFSQFQQNYRKIPDLILTPFFANGSTWPSYHIKPVYNDIEAPPLNDEKLKYDTLVKPNNDESEKSEECYKSYLDTAGTIALNVGMRPHTQHTNQMGQQYMYPTMPFYMPATKVGEKVPTVMYPPQPVYNQYPQTGVAV